MIFKRKKIASGTTLGGRLYGARKRKRITLGKVEQITHIRIKYLEALEKDDLNAFPSRIYALGYARRYGEFLGFETKKIDDDFRDEFGSASTFTPKGHQRKTFLPRLLLTPRLIIGIVIFLVVAGIIGYIGISISRLSQPPNIEITSPSEEAVAIPLVKIEGKTSDTAVVEINGQLVSVDNNGQFSQQVELVSGVNTFEISAKNRLGRESRETLKILYNKKDSGTIK